jgi:hypothetical protein
MNEYTIEPIQLLVDNTQPEYPQNVVRIAANVSVHNDAGHGVGLQYVFDVSGQPPADEFTAYDQLTKEQVISWITADGMADQVTEAYAAADQLLVVSSRPVQNPGLPWLPPAPLYPPLPGSAPASTVTTSISTSTEGFIMREDISFEKKLAKTLIKFGLLETDPTEIPVATL